MLYKLGRFAATRHWAVIAGWLAVAVLLGVAASGSGGKTRDVFTIPGTQSQRAVDVLAKRFPEANGSTALVVFRSPSGSLHTARYADAIAATTARMTKVPGATGASDPTEPIFANTLAKDGRIAYSNVAFGADVTKLPKDTLKRIEAAAAPARAAGLDVQYGGAVVDYLNPPTSAISSHADEIGIAIAIVILLVSLGSVVSMAMPITLALFALSCSSLLMVILEGHFTIGTVAPVLGTMIGLGVGIDYSLFIVSRHRQNLAAGMDVADAAGVAVGTSGSAVLFAAMTVCLALCGLALLHIPYVTTLGFCAALYVAVTVAAALTLLPAMLGALGHRVNALAIHHDDGGDGKHTLSARWAATVAKRPVVFCAVALVVLLALAAPLFSIRLGLSSDASAPTDTTQRQAYDLLTRGFGPGVNGPLLVAVALPRPLASDPSEAAALDRLATAIGHAPGVKGTMPPVPNKAGTAAIIEVTPDAAPTSPATADLVRELRNKTVPAATTGAIKTADVSVGGATAATIDLADLLSARLLPFIAGVIIGAFVLLMMVFRSILVPLNAAIMNVLSIGAAYGFVVAVFQWGWGRNLIGLQETVPIVAFVPVMMFAILFGLSMDYEVFLLSRIREDYDHNGDARAAVVNGLASTARVITSAALIMISVFLAFVTNPSPTVKMLGFGMAVAVLVDATIVRMMLVPATMELMSKWTWWLPGWLDRILPHLEVDKPTPAAAMAGASAAAASAAVTPADDRDTKVDVSV